MSVVTSVREFIVESGASVDGLARSVSEKK